MMVLTIYGFSKCKKKHKGKWGHVIPTKYWNSIILKLFQTTPHLVLEWDTKNHDKKIKPIFEN
jgi:hypothetical protein